LNASGVIPFSLITSDMVDNPLPIRQERGETAAAR
jgi:hypothetical protein